VSGTGCGVESFVGMGGLEAGVANRLLRMTRKEGAQEGTRFLVVPPRNDRANGP
jgi:hypothetical protein